MYNAMYYSPYYGGYLSHHGIKGQKWGVRRYQNEDGSLTAAGRGRYGDGSGGTQRSGMSDKTKARLKTAGKIALGAAAAGAAGYAGYKYYNSMKTRVGVGAPQLRIGTQGQNYFKNNTLRLTDRTKTGTLAQRFSAQIQRDGTALAVRNNTGVALKNKAGELANREYNQYYKDRRPAEIAALAGAGALAGAAAYKGAKNAKANREKVATAKKDYADYKKHLTNSQKVIDAQLYTPGREKRIVKLMSKKGLSAADARAKANAEAKIQRSIALGGMLTMGGIAAYETVRRR